MLLAKAGYTSTIRMGVLKEQEGRMKAHVWLEYDKQAPAPKPKKRHFVFFPGIRHRSQQTQYTDKVV
jgi:hypothetical protein